MYCFREAIEKYELEKAKELHIKNFEQKMYKKYGRHTREVDWIKYGEKLETYETFNFHKYIEKNGYYFNNIPRSKKSGRVYLPILGRTGETKSNSLWKWEWKNSKNSLKINDEISSSSVKNTSSVKDLFSFTINSIKRTTSNISSSNSSFDNSTSSLVYKEQDMKMKSCFNKKDFNNDSTNNRDKNGEMIKEVEIRSWDNNRCSLPCYFDRLRHEKYLSKWRAEEILHFLESNEFIQGINLLEKNLASSSSSLKNSSSSLQFEEDPEKMKNISDELDKKQPKIIWAALDDYLLRRVHPKMTEDHVVQTDPEEGLGPGEMLTLQRIFNKEG